MCLNYSRKMHFLVVSTVRALAVLFWPLSVIWRYLVHNNDSITDLVVNLSTITDSSDIFLHGTNWEIYFGFSAFVAHDVVV